MRDLNAKIVAQLTARGINSPAVSASGITIDRVVGGTVKRFQCPRPAFVTHEKLDAIAEQMKSWMQENNVS